jgi:hypothetical protein
MNTIYVSIASYMDQELYQTVHTMFEQADNPKNIFVSIYAQDDEHVDLQPIFDQFGIKKFNYEQVGKEKAKGVGYARARTQRLLNSKFHKYYLQVDSHTVFGPSWDTRMINDYERLRPFWKRYILSSYPSAYEYTEEGTVYFVESGIPVVEARPSSDPFVKYEAIYIDYIGEEFGQETGFFCAGQAFGYSEYFEAVPYDPSIYFQGEEQTLSIRFFDQDIKIVAPPDLYLFHDYVGHKRGRHWDKNPDWQTWENLSQYRLIRFYEKQIDDIFGLTNQYSIDNWVEQFVKEAPTIYQLDTQQPAG